MPRVLALSMRLRRTYISGRARFTPRSQQSCGCTRYKSKNRKHGLGGTKIYNVWLGMYKRRFGSGDKNYPDYGGRGITVCDEWRRDFKVFYDYVSKLEHYDEDGYSLDRIDTSKGYCPGNVRWATVRQQNRNRRTNRFFEVDDKQITVPDIAEIAGVHTSTIHARLKRGLSGEELLRPAQR